MFKVLIVEIESTVNAPYCLINYFHSTFTIETQIENINVH